MVNAAELIARIRQRKQELKSWEWWDTKVSSKVYHPPSSLAGVEASAPESLFLTKPERKRQRKLSRANEREDERKRIELGIVKPPPPKLSMKNVAAVYGAAYVQDPTKYELLAKKAEDERHRAHLAANEERKLNNDQKWEKHAQNVESHRQEGIHCAAFYTNTNLNSKNQYIVDYTSKKFLCSGACLLGDNDAFIVIESGSPEIQKISKLLTEKLGFELIWHGQLPAPNFKRWSMHSTPKRWEFLKVYGVESLLEQATHEFGPSDDNS